MIQTKENIGKLLERFVQGLTTESEEQLLSDYFCTAEAIPEEWMVYKELFDSFSTDVYDFSEDEKDAMLARVSPKESQERNSVDLGGGSLCRSGHGNRYPHDEE